MALPPLTRSIHRSYFDPEWYGSAVGKVFANGDEAFRNYTRYHTRDQAPCSYFDPTWYVKHYKLSAFACLDPFVHYVLFGWKKGHNPSPRFNGPAYLRANPDVARAGMDPLYHFVCHGRAEGRPLVEPRGSHRSSHRPLDETQDNPSRVALPEFPLVSILITNRDGRDFLPSLFQSLAAQTYKNFEVIFSDDASSDDSVDIARQFNARIVGRSKSVGYAQANNDALRAAKGELILLLNNDTRVDPNLLSEMIRPFKIDPAVGATAAKTLFWSPFVNLTLRAESEFSIRRDDLLSSMHYKKLFLRIGQTNDGETIDAAQPDSDGHVLSYDLPANEPEWLLKFQDTPTQMCSVKVGLQTSMVEVSAGQSLRWTVPPPALTHSQFVINNAGSLETSDGGTADRGFGEVDRGQYNHDEDVPLFCGCAAMVRRDALAGRPLFIEQFKAYFEDSELSQRIRRAGFKIRYASRAIVYHYHSASHTEKSTYWRYQTIRNRYLYRLCLEKDDVRPDIAQAALLEINHLETCYREHMHRLGAEERELCHRLPAMRREIKAIAAQLCSQNLPQRECRRIAVYNPFWETRGGGEAHALDVAETLTTYGSVELLSTNDFDLQDLCSYFGKPADRFLRRIVPRWSKELTAEYDIVVNSCFQDETPSLAELSYYIVSFPSATPLPAFLSSYKFLPNSNFTLSWMKRLWGESGYRYHVLNPAVSDEFRCKSPKNKTKTILSVGRFASNGHVKCQLEIAEIFVALCAELPDLMKDWRLLLIGSCNDAPYVASVQKILKGANAEIMLNATAQNVHQAYRQAAIYVHACGLGRNADTEPEFHEHFGMAVAQAVSARAYPIVYAHGGPREIVEAAGYGTTFSSRGELKRVLAAEIGRHSTLSVGSRPKAPRKMFSRDDQRLQIEQMLELDLSAARISL